MLDDGPRHAESWTSRAAVRTALALLACAVVAVGSVPWAVAAPLTARTYDGPAYSPALGAATRPESQSKLWFHAGAWWALLLEPTGRTVRVFELMPDHTWRPTSAVVTTDAADVGDALHDGDTVHIANRHGDGALYYVRLAFDPATRDYRADPPRLVVDHGGGAAASIAQDTTGRLWIGYATPIRVVVTYSDDGVSWAPNIPLSIREEGGPSEMAALVAYDDRVGILWSDQTTNSFQFASHRHGDDPGVWVREQALSGQGAADDHISLKRVDGEGGDTLVAAVKTSRGDSGESADSALIEVLARTPDGRWSHVPVSTIADDLNDPVLQVDPQSRTVYLFASRHGTIVTKQASLDDLRFEAGIGQVFMVRGSGAVANPTSTKDPVGSGTGMVVLASDGTANAYRHAEAPIGDHESQVDLGHGEPLGPPEELRARAISPNTVALTWEEVVDRDRWVPGEDGVRAAGYVVLRDGVEIATVTQPYLRDEIGEDPADRPAVVHYTVHAVDRAGSRSEPATAVIDLPAAESGDGRPWLPLAAVAGLAAAVLVVALVHRRRRSPGVR